MRPARPFSARLKRQLADLLDQASTRAAYERILCVWLRVTLGLPAPQVAAALGWHAGAVRNLQARVWRDGLTVLQTPGRGSRHRENLTPIEEETLLEGFCLTAGQGGVVEAGPIRQAYEKQFGHTVHKSTVYRMLARHGWRKLAPRPQHPDASAKEQAAFKKSSAVL